MKISVRITTVLTVISVLITVAAVKCCSRRISGSPKSTRCSDCPRRSGHDRASGSTVRLKRQIPYTEAMEMILTGEPLTAAEAYHFGLVGHVVPQGKAREIAAVVTANGPRAVRNAKASILTSGWLDEDDARKIEQRFVVEVMRSEDAKEGLAAFGGKRAPRFTGQ